MKNILKRRFGLVILISFSVAISSCGRSKNAENEITVTPVENKVAISPVKEKEVLVPAEEKKVITPAQEAEVSAPVKEEVVTTPVEKEAAPPVNWENLYGPEGEDKIITIGELYVAKWIDNAGTGRNAVMTWHEAENWASELDWLGKTDWRLPTQAELKMIYREKGMIGACEAGEYWASTLHPRIPDRMAVTVNFATGGGRYRDKVGKYFVRVVRP